MHRSYVALALADKLFLAAYRSGNNDVAGRLVHIQLRCDNRRMTPPQYDAVISDLIGFASII